MKAHNFKELNVWQKGIEIVVNIYKLTCNFPKEEKFGLTSQIQRCAVSIPSNIAEGCGRTSEKELQHFLSISLGSSSELETQLIVSSKLGYINEDELKNVIIELTIIQKMLYKFYDSIKIAATVREQNT